MANQLSTVFTAGKGGLLYSLDHAAYVTGRSSVDVFTVADAMYGASVETAEHYGNDLVIVHSDPFLCAEAIGAMIEYPDAGPPMLKARPVIDSIDESACIHHGRIPLLLEVVDRIVRHFQNEDRVISTSVTGPFSLAGCIMGESEFLARIPNAHDELITYVLSLATRVVLYFIEAIIRTGSSVMVAEPLASLVHQDTFRCRVIPALVRIREMGDVYFHFCGRIMHLVDAFMTLSPAYISLDEADLRSVFTRSEEDIRYIGGLDSLMIFQGFEGPIRERIYGLRQNYGAERLLVCSGCDLIWNTPPSHGKLVMNIIHGNTDYR